ncbi:MAG: ATP-binding protein [Myxococcaceae bacterium]
MKTAHGTVEQLETPRESELLAHLMDAVIAVDDRQRVVYWGPGAERLYGVPAASALGRPRAELYAFRWLTPDDERAAATAIERDGQWRGRNEHLLPSGKLLLVESTVGRWLREDGTPGGLVAVVCDVSREQTLESEALAARSDALAQAIRAAEEAREQAEAASRAKDLFLAILGHELRNPLAPITLTIELMKRRAPGILERERDVIERQARHLQALVDDLLDVSRIGRGVLQLARETVELAPLADAALESIQPLLAQRRHRVVNHVARGLVVDGDPMRVRQIFASLLNNAAKYTAEGGEIRLSSQVSEGMVSIAISDDGIGLAADVIPRLFDPFFKAPQGKERAVGGLGVGLALVRSLAQLHGGGVRAESPGPGLGSTFTVELPLLASDTPPQR